MVEPPPPPPCCRHYRKQILLIIFSWIATFLAAAIGCYVGLPQSTQTLAIASDVIDCNLLPGGYSWLYSHFRISQVASDKSNDNEDGIPMDIYSIIRDNLTYHILFPSPKIFSGSLTTNKFIIPLNYYNRPWYMRVNSSISLEFRIESNTNSKFAPFAYVIKGDGDANSFLNSNRRVPSRHECKIDVIKTPNETVIIRGNDYYYVVVVADAESIINFFARVTFNVVYLDSDDLSGIARVRTVDGTGVSQALPFKESNTTLCFIHNITGEANSVHLHMDFVLDYFVLIPMVILLASMVSVIVFLLYFCIKKRTTSRTYIPLNSF